MAIPAKESPPKESPSPVIPLVVLLLVGVMLSIPTMMSYDPTVYWTSTIAEVQTHFVVGALLIPVCLLLVVQAIGIPHVNPTEPSTPSSPVVESASQDLTTSVIIVAIIFFLFMILPLRNLVRGPWPTAPTQPRRSRWW